MLILLLGFIFIAGCDDKNIINDSLIFNGKLVSHSDCKKDTENFQSDEVISKVDYQFDKSLNTLSLKHINVQFNCCPDSLKTDIVLVNDTIFIKEYEVNGKCRCVCLYDLDMLITGVEAKKYTIKITQPLQIIFDVDLEKNPIGSFNVIKE